MKNKPLRLCVIGNSHVAALKTAWDRLKPDRPDFSLTFFAAKTILLRHLKIEGGTLEPTDESVADMLSYTSGGQRRIEVGAYGQFLVSGLQFKLPALARHYSAAVAEAALRKAYEKSLNATIAGMLRTLTPAAIHIAHNPLPCRTDVKLHKQEYRSYADTLGLLNHLFEPKKLAFLPQPEETVEEIWFSRPEFTQDAPRLAVKEIMEGARHSEAGTHLNGDFGVIYLNALLRHIRSGDVRAQRHG